MEKAFTQFVPMLSWKKLSLVGKSLFKRRQIRMSKLLRQPNGTSYWFLKRKEVLLYSNKGIL